MTTRSTTAFMAVLCLLAAPTLVHAQCSNLTGNPPPTATEEYGANRLRLKYLATGPGGGDDRPEISKSTFNAPALVFDPQFFHTSHFTIRKNGIAGTVMWSATLPPDATHWTSTTLSNGNVRWKYSDPAAPFGIKKAQFVEYVGGLHIWTYVRAVNASIVGAPLVPGVDQGHLLVEIENSGSGICYDGIASECSGMGNTQTCAVP